MTSAPRPARVNPQYSACSSASSMTRIPVRGPRLGWVFIVARIYPVRRGGNMPTDSAARVHLSIAEARTLSERAMRGIGYDAEEARILADHVIDAALCGYEYSGLPKLLNVAEHARFKAPRAPMRALKETTVSVLYDVGNQSGKLGMYYAPTAVSAPRQRTCFAVPGVR